MSTTENLKDYLGDGVYAEHVGHGIELRVNDHRNFVAVFLEPDVLAALNNFSDRANKILSQKDNNEDNKSSNS